MAKKQQQQKTKQNNNNKQTNKQTKNHGLKRHFALLEDLGIVTKVLRHVRLEMICHAGFSYVVYSMSQK